MDGKRHVFHSTELGIICEETEGVRSEPAGGEGLKLPIIGLESAQPTLNIQKSTPPTRTVYNEMRCTATCYITFISWTLANSYSSPLRHFLELSSVGTSW